jgi:hypothetical protein
MEAKSCQLHPTIPVETIKLIFQVVIFFAKENSIR